MTDDFDLLAAWQRGDRSAGSELFARYFPSVYGFFRAKLAHLAEDLTQETFLRCEQSRAEFRAEGSFRAYIFAIARNLLYEHLRRGWNRAGRADFEEESLEDLVPSPSAILVAHEQDKVLVHALRRLPLALQITLEFYYVQRLRGNELARVLELPPGTVRSRIRRGVEHLRRAIEELTAGPQPIRTTLTDLQRWAEHVRAEATTPSEGSDVSRSRG